MDVAIPTGLGEARNALVVRAADALIAVGGGYGTLSEIALALKAGKRVVGLGTWDIDGVVGDARGRRAAVLRGARLDSPAMAGQSDTPYLDALRAYAEREPGRASTCPATRAGAGADPRAGRG